MTSLLDLGKQHILAAYNDDASRGIALVCPSPKLNRLRLVAWAIVGCAMTQKPGESPFRALYAADQMPLVVTAQREVRGQGKQRNRPLSEQVIEPGTPTLPDLQEITYATIRGLRRIGDQFEPNCLDLLVLDERASGQMAPLVPLVERTNPLFLLVVTSREPAAGWPWAYLGTPIVLQGEAQTPPRPAPNPESDS